MSGSVFTARICPRVKIFIILIVITLTVTAGGIEFIKSCGIEANRARTKKNNNKYSIA